MDILATLANGGLPITLDDFRWMDGQLTNQGIIATMEGMLVGEAGDDFIISGCVVTGSNPTKTLTAGWILLGGEILRVDAISATLDTSTNDFYVKATSTFDAAGDKTALNGTSVQMYEKKRATITASSGNLTSTGNRLYSPTQDWADEVFAAGDYTSTAGTWTVDAGDVTTSRYILEGKRLTWTLTLVSTDLASATSASLIVALPNGFTSKSANTMMIGKGNGAGFAQEVMQVLLQASNQLVGFSLFSGNWPIDAGISLSCTIVCEVE